MSFWCKPSSRSTSMNGGTMHTVKFAKEQIRPLVVVDLPEESNKNLIEEGFPIIQILKEK